jgi:Tfp pilus assembly protein PilN
MTWEIVAALVPSALAVLASHIRLQSEITRLSTRMQYLEEERSEMKTMLQDLCQMVNEIKLILAKNQM